MGLLDRTKAQTNTAPNAVNAKFGSKKGSYSLTQVRFKKQKN